MNSNSMSYVTKLEFQESDVSSQICAGTVVHKFFIATTKYCCQSGNTVKISSRLPKFSKPNLKLKLLDPVQGRMLARGE